MLDEELEYEIRDIGIDGQNEKEDRNYINIKMW
jgi:hypothetical protein